MFRRKGTIVEWNDDRGFGFIAPAKGGERVFCHIKSFRDLAQRPARGQVFTYSLARDMGGRARAREIRPVDATARGLDSSPRAETAASGSFGPYVGGLFFLCVLTALVYFGRLPWLVFPLYLALSLVTLLWFRWGKASARSGFRRAFWVAAILNVLALAALAYGGPAIWGAYVPHG